LEQQIYEISLVDGEWQSSYQKNNTNWHFFVQKLTVHLFYKIQHKMTQSIKSINDRIDVRISKEQKELIKSASELSGFKSLTEFIVYTTSREASRIIEEKSMILKSLEDKKIFVEAILNPPTPNDKLRKAHSNYQKFINQNES
jgi:uncharacterized protein (DUF1778 family)